MEGLQLAAIYAFFFLHLFVQLFFLFLLDTLVISVRYPKQPVIIRVLVITCITKIDLVFAKCGTHHTPAQCLIVQIICASNYVSLAWGTIILAWGTIICLGHIPDTLVNGTLLHCNAPSHVASLGLLGYYLSSADPPRHASHIKVIT